MLTPMPLFSVTKLEMVQDEFVRHVHVTIFRNQTNNGLLFDSECPPAAGAQWAPFSFNKTACLKMVANIAIASRVH